jgi:hypothetical protein
VAASGEIYWPPTGRSIWPLTVEANRQYLAAAVDDPRTTEGSRWAMSCLSYDGKRLSAISMKGMEPFVLFPPRNDTSQIGWFLNLAKEPLLARYGTLHRFGERFPQLIVDEKTRYKDGGPDQMRIRGDAQQLTEVFADEAVREGARALAERLMQWKTPYARFHSYVWQTPSSDEDRPLDVPTSHATRTRRPQNRRRPGRSTRRRSVQVSAPTTSCRTGWRRLSP